MNPLNGNRTHALTDAALQVLACLSREDLPRQEINPGVCNRLLREFPAVVEQADLPSPYRTHRGKLIEHFRILPAGRELLANRGIR